MIIPYFCFYGSCSDALEFYAEAFSAAPEMVQYYGEYVPKHTGRLPDNISQWVLHAEMTLADSRVWFADEVSPREKNGLLSLTATVKTTAEAAWIFDHLSNGGSVTLPPTETFYSTFHAGITDRFGVNWSIVSDEPPTSEPS